MKEIPEEQKSSLSVIPQHGSIKPDGKLITELEQTKPSLTHLKMILDQESEKGMDTEWTIDKVQSLRTYLTDSYFQKPSGEQMAVTTKQLISMAKAYGYKFDEQAYIGETKEHLRNIPADLLEKAVKRVRERSSNGETFRIPMIGDLREAVSSELFERHYPLTKLKTIEFLIKLKEKR